jgi:hypothetical protein
MSISSRRALTGLALLVGLSFVSQIAMSPSAHARNDGNDRRIERVEKVEKVGKAERVDKPESHRAERGDL